MEGEDNCGFAADLFAVFQGQDGICYGYGMPDLLLSEVSAVLLIYLTVPGKVGMSVLTKGLAMDFVRQGRGDMAITSIWPAVVCPLPRTSPPAYI